MAEWTERRNSGRVGRTAAAKVFDPAALRLAVVAHIFAVDPAYRFRRGTRAGSPRDGGAAFRAGGGARGAARFRTEKEDSCRA